MCLNYLRENLSYPQREQFAILHHHAITVDPNGQTSSLGPFIFFAFLAATIDSLTCLEEYCEERDFQFVNLQPHY